MTKDAQLIRFGLQSLTRGALGISVALGLAGAASAAPYDGVYTGTYSCGPTSGATSLSAFSVPFEAKIASSTVSGKPQFKDSVESMSGEVTVDGAISIRSDGHFVPDNGRAWQSRFAGSVAPTSGSLAGGMYVNGSSKVRDCTLAYRRQSSTIGAALSRPALPAQGMGRLPVLPPTVQDGGQEKVAPVQALTTPPADAWLGTVAPLYVGKKEFLAAVSKGQFIGLGAVSETSVEANALIASVAYILVTDYRTPVPKERDSYCIAAAPTSIFAALVSETARHAETLSSSPPTFASPGKQDATARTAAMLANVRDACSRVQMGRREPLPMNDSFAALLAAYSEATKRYVETKRAQLVASYQSEQKRKQEAAAEAEAVRRDALQKQIDLERKRIEDSEQEKKQRAAKRISG